MQKQKFQRYCRRFKNRWGTYYDIVQDSAVSFNPQFVRTVFKLYGKAVPGMNLDQELVKLFDGPKVRGGFVWLKKLHRKMQRAGLMK